jgi:hypothetical protein
MSGAFGTTNSRAVFPNDLHTIPIDSDPAATQFFRAESTL